MLKFLERLKIQSTRQMWYFKTHGEPMQVRGIPDVLMCYHGLFFCMEFKIKRHGKIAVTPYQEYTQELITKANGISLVIWHDEDNADVGIGSRKFDTIEKAVEWLVDVLDSALKIPCCKRNTESS
jgi:hypothetical protein